MTLATRVIAVIIFIAAVISVVFGIDGLVRAREMGHFLASVAPRERMPLGPEDWIAHWRVAAAVMLATGLILAPAAAGLFHRRKWAVPLIGSVLLVLLLMDLAGTTSGYSRYAFEIGDASDRLLLLGGVLVCAVVTASRRSRKASATV